MSSWSLSSVCAVTLLCSMGVVHGQVGHNPMPPLGEFLEYKLDSGPRVNVADRPHTVYTEVVHTPNAAWTRLFFEEVELERGSVVRFTSLLDGEVQMLDAEGMKMWGNSTAYFNGDTVLIELIAAPGTQLNRLLLNEVQVESIGAQQIGLCGICGSDTRVPSNEDWAARVMNPGVCSAAVFNTDSCLVTAGHCISGNNQVVQFRVPNSFSNCNVANPPVANQFPILEKTFVDGGVGNDWGVMTSGTNNLGQTIYDRYGQHRPIASAPANVGQPVDVWGYGASLTCTLNHTQQHSTGTIQQRFTNYYRHTADTTGGNSGGAILHNNQIIGVVTHCPCPNFAQRIDRPSFANAIEALCPSMPVPSNNICTNPIVVGAGTTPFSTVGAFTTGPSEDAHCTIFGDGQIHNDIWYVHTAQCDGDLTISLCGSSYQTKLAVYNLPCPTNPGSVIACDLNSCVGESRAQVTVPTTAGQAFRIRIGGHAGATGEGLLTISCTEPVEPCPADLTSDGVVDVSDLLALFASWGSCPGCAADINGDGFVDVSDLLLLFAAWGQCD